VPVRVRITEKGVMHALGFVRIFKTLIQAFNNLTVIQGTFFVFSTVVHFSR